MRDSPRVLPDLPPQQVLVTYSVARERQGALQHYLRQLLEIKPVAESDILTAFFQSSSVDTAGLTRVNSRPMVAASKRFSTIQ